MFKVYKSRVSSLASLLRAHSLLFHNSLICDLYKQIRTLSLSPYERIIHLLFSIDHLYAPASARMQ